MSTVLESARMTLRIEGNAILRLCELLGDDYERAVRAIIRCKGKVIVTGMGKSGIIGKKIAATLASTGTPSFFLHPGEAYHGDLGMIETDDMVLCLSNSGETDEVLKLISFLKENGNSIIAMTGHSTSTLAKHSNYHLNTNVEKEACPLELAPTASTSAQLAMGDALAISIMTERGFESQHYARFHPGGSLGRKLLTKAKDLMKSENLPVIDENSTLIDVIHCMTNGRLGLSVVIKKGVISGIITDGDMRRTMEKHEKTFFSLRAKDIMTSNPKCISKDLGIIQVQEKLKEFKINSVLVAENNKLIGVVQIYDIK